MAPITGAHLRRIITGTAVAAAVVVPIAVAAPAAQAAGSVVSAVSLAAPTAAPYGSQISLTGTVWRYRTTTKIAGAPVVLQRSAHGRNTWSTLKSTTTASNGTFAFSVTQTLAYDYRAYYPGSTVYRAGVSAVKYPIVMQKVLFDGIATTDREEGLLRATGRVYPAPPSGSLVYLQRYDAGANTWRSIGSTRSTGSANVGVTAKVGGSTGYYRLHAPTRAPYGAGTSAARKFSHYVWRGIFNRPVLAHGGAGEPEFGVITELQDRTLAVMLANPGGYVWADVNTTSCLRLVAIGLNATSEAAALRVLNGSTVLGSATAAGGSAEEPGESAPVELAIGGLSKVRVMLIDTGASEPLDGAVFVGGLCAG